MLLPGLSKWSSHSPILITGTGFCLCISSMPCYSGSPAISETKLFILVPLGYQPWYSHLIFGLSISSSSGLHSDAGKSVFF